eukprot:gene29206-35254_t
MYVIEPGEQKEVQAASDPIGLKIGAYMRYQVKNGSTLTVTYINGGDISTFGDNTSSMGKGKIREKDMSQFAVVVEALTYQPPLTRAPFRKV